MLSPTSMLSNNMLAQAIYIKKRISEVCLPSWFILDSKLIWSPDGWTKNGKNIPGQVQIIRKVQVCPLSMLFCHLNDIKLILKAQLSIIIFFSWPNQSLSSPNQYTWHFSGKQQPFYELYPFSRYRSGSNPAPLTTPHGLPNKTLWDPLLEAWKYFNTSKL